MTMTELLTAATLLLAATSTSLQLNSSSAAALAAVERRLQDVDRLDTELALVERQLRDLAAGLPMASAAGADPIERCALTARSLREQLQALPAIPGMTRQVEERSGPGGLLAVELRSEASNLARQRIISLAALGLCGGSHGTP